MLHANHESARMPRAEPGAPALRLLQEVPGIADIVWAVLARVDLAHDPVRLVFVSAERRSGNSVLAAATAIGLVRHVRVPVCLVEANVEHPALAGYLGLRSAGLSDVLDVRCELADCLQSPPECPGLYVLPGGTPRKPVSGEFATERMRSILEEIGAMGGYLVIDAPCVLDHLESRVLLQQVDAALLVLRAGRTRQDAAARAHRILLQAGAPLLGSIFNAYGRPRIFTGTDPYRLSKDELGRAGRSSLLIPRSGSLPEPVSTNGKHPAESEGALEEVDVRAAPLNGATPLTLGPDSDARHQREIEVLERRIAKLTALLAHTEADLCRMAAAKNIDLGLSSMYRGVQGLSENDGALAFKKDLMRKIFQANLELKHAMQPRS
jgi:Mrp family chromosome partitioning ATPase